MLRVSGWVADYTRLVDNVREAVMRVPVSPDSDLRVSLYESMQVRVIPTVDMEVVLIARVNAERSRRVMRSDYAGLCG